MSEGDLQPEEKSRLAERSSAVLAAFRQTSQNNLSLISAGVAFFAMMSIFPGLAALVALLSLIANPEVVIVQLEEVRPLMPEDVYDILHHQIVGLVSTSSGTLQWAGTVSILIALWSARSGVAALMQGLNAAYGTAARSTWRLYVRSYFLTVGLVLVGIVALMALVVAPVILAFFPLGAKVTVIAELLRWSVAVFVVFAGIGLLYRFGPNRKAPGVQALSAGALFAGISWAVVSMAFSHYVQYFASYNQVYGSIGAVIAMLVWLWISSFLILFGGALNGVLDHRKKLAGTGQPEPATVENDGAS